MLLRSDIHLSYTPIYCFHNLISKTLCRRFNRPSTISFYYVDLNGYQSKKESLKQIIDENNIHIPMLTETKVCSKTATKLSGFQVFPVVRTSRYRSGLAIAIKYGICTAVMIDEWENAEFASVKMTIGSKQIRFILASGIQFQTGDR